MTSSDTFDNHTKILMKPSYSISYRAYIYNAPLHTNLFLTIAVLYLLGLSTPRQGIRTAVKRKTTASLRLAHRPISSAFGNKHRYALSGVRTAIIALLSPHTDPK